MFLVILAASALQFQTQPAVPRVFTFNHGTGLETIPWRFSACNAAGECEEAQMPVVVRDEAHTRIPKCGTSEAAICYIPVPRAPK